MQRQAHIFYSGSVQGVGFRFTAEAIAAKLGVCGWVKNLPSGQVEIVAEAEEKALDDFLSEMQKAFSHYIREVDVEWLNPQGKFKHFGVEF